MATVEYSVSGQKITTTAITDPLVKGTIGEYDVAFTFDSAWDTFEEKWAVFDPDNGDPWKQPIDNGACEFPGEVMWANSVIIGVYGVKDGVEFPTIWANRLWFKDGANVPADVSDYPEPSPVLAKLVSTDPQTFTVEQKAQARENIDALGKIEGTEGDVVVIGSNGNIVDGGHRSTDAFPVGSASGSIVTIEDGADNVPIKSMTVQIEPVQAGSGDPSPSNVRAISGWTGAHSYRVGKNLLYCSMGSGTYRGMTYTKNSDGSYTISNTATQYGTFLITTSGVETKLKEGDYTLSVGSQFNPSTTTYNLSFEIYNNGSWAEHKFQSAGVNKETFHASAIRNVKLFVNNGIATNFTIYPQLEYGTQQTAYEPYAITTYTVNFPSEAGTVYGGQLQVNEDGSGTLTVNRKGLSLTEDDAWTELASGKFYINGVTSDAYSAHFATGSRVGEYISNLYPFSGSGKSTSSTITTDKRFYGQVSNNRIWVYDSSYDTLDDWKAALHITPLTIVYPINTPITYQLTSPQVHTLLGLNNIWADTGDIAVEYHADPTIFVEEKTKAIKQSIAPVEDGYTASQAYAVGSFLFVGDTLYKVTSAIASGATITPNTNCVQTTVAEQLIALA